MTERKREGGGRARLQEVAGLAGVSTATVSRAFNDPDKVSAVVRERVLEAATALNWIPDAAGRALASRRTQIVGAIIPTIDNEIFARQVGGMQSVLAERGFTLILGCSNYDVDESLKQVRAMLARGVEALVLAGENYPASVFEALHRHRIPYVVTYAYRPDSPHPCVGFDHRAAFEEIADLLLSLGHTRFGAIFQPMADNDRVRDRLLGLGGRLASRGLVLDPGCLRIGPSTAAFGAESFASLMGQTGRPTAVVCGSDMLALGAVSVAPTLGVGVPDDCSITGFDDLAISSLFEPKLTTMWVDNLAIGRLAADHLLSAMRGEDRGPSVRLVPELRRRATTGAARAAG